MVGDTLEIREDFLQRIDMCPVLLDGIPEVGSCLVFRSRPVLRVLISVNPTAEVLCLNNEDSRARDDKVVNLAGTSAGRQQQIADDRKALAWKCA